MADPPRDDVILLLIEIQSEVKLISEKIQEEIRVRDVLIKSEIERIDIKVEKLDKKFDNRLNVAERLLIFHDKEIGKLKTKADRSIFNTQIEKIKNEVVGEIANAKREQSDHDWKHEADLAATIVHMKKVEEGLQMNLEVKKDPWVIIPVTLIIIGIGVLFAFGKLSWPVAAGFVSLTLMPSIIGRKSDTPEILAKIAKLDTSKKDDEP